MNTSSDATPSVHLNKPAAECNDVLGVAVQTLNEAFKADPAAIDALFKLRVGCNTKLADHPTIVVGGRPDTVGTLGVINGIVQRLTGRRIAAIYDDDTTQLKGFVEYNKPI